MKPLLSMKSSEPINNYGLSYKTFDHRILDGFPRPNEIERHSVLVSPGIERLGRKLAPIV